MKKPKLVKTDLDEQILDLARQTDHKTAVIWAGDCAERVLPYFEERYPADDRPRKAIEASRSWLRTGVFKMADIRKASLDSHAAARGAEEGSAARSAARAAGQAVAAAHVGMHSAAAAIYAATAVRDGAEAAGADAAVVKERDWQLRHLIELRQNKG